MDRLSMRSFYCGLLFLVLTFINGGTQLYLHKSNNLNSMHELEVKTNNNLAVLESNFHHYFSSAFLTAKALAQSDLLISNIQQPNQKTALELFELSLRNDASLIQIRFIDTQGQEHLRVHRDAFGAPIEIVPTHELQNKSHREYVQQGLQLKSNEYHWSSIDLNQEHGEIEIPYKPTRRITFPVFEKNQKLGMIVINVCMSKLRILLGDLNDNLYLIDTEGHFKWHINKDKDWTRELGLPDRADMLLSRPHVYSHSIQGTDMLFVSDQRPAAEALQDQVTQRQWVYGLIFEIIILIFLIILLQVLSQRQLKKELNQQKNELQDSQQLLIKQSRNALMGEMLAMIAHQWKQPLNVIKLNASFLRTQINRNEALSGPQTKLYSKALSAIESMVEEQDATVADFRDFYNPSKEVDTFSIHQSTLASIQLLNYAIEYNEIDLRCNHNYYLLTGVEREFRQVMTNLIKNAIDQIVSTQVSQPRIIINSSADDNELIVTISDNAGGIDDNIVDTLFDAYVSTKSLNGTGLGLYMTQMIIENTFNGTITAYNKNGGAVFEMRFPNYGVQK